MCLTGTFALGVPRTPGRPAPRWLELGMGALPIYVRPANCAGDPLIQRLGEPEQAAEDKGRMLALLAARIDRLHKISPLAAWGVTRGMASGARGAGQRPQLVTGGVDENARMDDS